MLSTASLSKQQEMTSSFGELDSLIKKIDVNYLMNDVPQLPVFQRLNQTAKLSHQLIGEIFEDNYGILDINYDNLEKVYDAHHTGIATLAATRDHLLDCGMSDKLADNLM